MDIETRIIKYLAACPPAFSGQNGSTQTFTVACHLYNGFSLDEHQTLHYLNLYNQRCQPEWNEREILHKVNEAVKAQHSKPRGHLLGSNGKYSGDDFKSSSFPAKALPKADKVKIDPVTEIEVFLKGFSCEEADVWEASPIRPPDDFSLDAVCLLENLYNPGEIINYVTASKPYQPKEGGLKAIPTGYGLSVERNELIDNFSLAMPGNESGGWMRMNPVDGKGIADANITHFRFVLLEFDCIPTDIQLRLLARLPLPIAAILTSGGRSLHAWVKVDEQDITGYRDSAAMLLKMLGKFGLDEKNKNPSRLSRLVGVTRKLGASGDGKQRLLYLNPEPGQKGILG